MPTTTPPPGLETTRGDKATVTLTLDQFSAFSILATIVSRVTKRWDPKHWPVTFDAWDNQRFEDMHADVAVLQSYIGAMAAAALGAELDARETQREEERKKAAPVVSIQPATIDRLRAMRTEFGDDEPGIDFLIDMADRLLPKGARSMDPATAAETETAEVLR